MRRPFYHLTLEDREIIAEGISEGLTLRDIAITVGKDPTSISREVKRYRIEEGRSMLRRTNICQYAANCKVSSLCSSKCRKLCARCLSRHCFDICPDFVEMFCRRTSRWPYVCNGCDRSHSCGYLRFRYRPLFAQGLANKARRESRNGIILSKEELLELDSLITPLLKDNKQSVEVVWKAHADKIPVSAPTLRRYIDSGKCKTIRLDLLSAPSRAPRKRSRIKLSRHLDDGRSYSDFCDLDEALRKSSWEMDTVHGSKRDRSCLFTLLNRDSLFLFIFKLPACTSESVIGVLDYLEILCEEADVTFYEIFGEILTDNGPEMSDCESIEASCLGEGKRGRIFYCDPYSSSQKPYIEGRHTLIRRVLPKGEAIDSLTHDKVALLASHINSYPAISRGGRTPYDMASTVMPTKLLEDAGVLPLPVGEVRLVRDLLAS